MDVRDILDRVADESLGGENIAPEERRTHLRLLNVVYRELYKSVAPYNFMALKSDRVKSAGGKLSVALNALNINHVFHEGLNLPLREISPSQRMMDREGNKGYFPYSWLRGSDMKTIQLTWPEKDGTDFSVLWVPSSVDLLETTLEGEIPFPREFLDVLVDGTLLRVDADAGGFNHPRRVQDAQMRFLSGKTDLMNYFYNNWGRNISSFLRV